MLGCRVPRVNLGRWRARSEPEASATVQVVPSLTLPAPIGAIQVQVVPSLTLPALIGRNSVPAAEGGVGEGESIAEPVAQSLLRGRADGRRAAVHVRELEHPEP